MQGVSRENKLRLLMIYAALNPENFEGNKGAKLMQVNLWFYILSINLMRLHYIITCVIAFSCLRFLGDAP
jgi:hypothetical protein